MSNQRNGGFLQNVEKQETLLELPKTNSTTTYVKYFKMKDNQEFYAIQDWFTTKDDPDNPKLNTKKNLFIPAEQAKEIGLTISQHRDQFLDQGTRDQGASA